MIQHPPEPPGQTLAAQAVSALRTLSADMVEAAGSGHPGTPLGAAPMAYVLCTKVLLHSVRNPAWPDYNCFIRSPRPRHTSVFTDALLHLTGYNLLLEELKRFRQWGGKTLGQPQYVHTLCVEKIAPGRSSLKLSPWLSAFRAPPRRISDV